MTGAPRHRRAVRRHWLPAVAAVCVAVAVVVAILVGILGRGIGDGRPEADRSGVAAARTGQATGAGGPLVRGAVPAADERSAAQRRLDALGGRLGLDTYQGTWQVYIEDLATGASLAVGDHAAYAASVIKLYVMLAVFQRIADGALADTPQVERLLEQMVTVSSNEATNTLVRMLASDGERGFDVVTRVAREHGFASVNLSQWLGVLDGDVQAKRTSASDAGRFLAAAYRGQLVSREASERMIGLLLGQTRRAKIPGGVPGGVAVANKTGEAAGVDNDAAIVFGSGSTDVFDGTGTAALGRRGDYVLIVMTEGIADAEATRAAIRSLSATVWATMET